MKREIAEGIKNAGEVLGLRFTIYPAIPGAEQIDQYVVACPKTLFLNEEGARRELEILRSATCEG